MINKASIIEFIISFANIHYTTLYTEEWGFDSISSNLNPVLFADPFKYLVESNQDQLPTCLSELKLKDQI